MTDYDPERCVCGHHSADHILKGTACGRCGCEQFRQRPPERDPMTENAGERMYALDLVKNAVDRDVMELIRDLWSYRYLDLSDGQATRTVLEMAKLRLESTFEDLLAGLPAPAPELDPVRYVVGGVRVTKEEFAEYRRTGVVLESARARAKEGPPA